MYAFIGFKEVIKASQALEELEKTEPGGKAYMRIEVNTKTFQLYHSFDSAASGAVEWSEQNNNLMKVAVIEHPIDEERLANLLLNAFYKRFVLKDWETEETS